MSGVEPDPVELLVDSLKIHSPPSAEAKYATFLTGVLKSLGYSRVRSDPAGNVLGELGRGSRTLLLCGHMDTVPGMLTVRREGDLLFGRGAADAKSPLCALLVAGARSTDAGLRVTFAGVTREETDSLGIQQIAASQRKFDYAVFGEPSGAGRVTVGYRGRVGMHLNIATAGGHAGASWANASAFDEFLSVLSRLKELETRETVKGSGFDSLSVTPTVVQAGKHRNVVPPTCDATFDVRIPPRLKSASVISSIKAALGPHSEGAKVRLDFEEPTEAYQAPRDSTIVRAFQRAIILRLKSRPVLTKKTGTGDMNYFASKTDAECVTYGPGAADASHREDESVSLRDYVASIDVLTEAISQLGRLSRD
jgi:LysW-gamma-L-lysine carboxypeptidase